MEIFAKVQAPTLYLIAAELGLLEGGEPRELKCQNSHNVTLLHPQTGTPVLSWYDKSVS